MSCICEAIVILVLSSNNQIVNVSLTDVQQEYHHKRKGVVQWVARLTRKLSVVGSLLRLTRKLSVVGSLLRLTHKLSVVGSLL